MSMPADSNQPIDDSSESISPYAANFRTVSVNSAVEMLERSNLVKVDPVKLRDFLDACKGEMSVGCGKASGENRAEIATDMALASVSSQSGGCDNVTSALVGICGSADMSMNEYNVIVRTILGKLPDDASFLMGVSADNTWQDSIQVTVLLG